MTTLRKGSSSDEGGIRKLVTVGRAGGETPGLPLDTWGSQLVTLESSETFPSGRND